MCEGRSHLITQIDVTSEALGTEKLLVSRGRKKREAIQQRFSGRAS